MRSCASCSVPFDEETGRYHAPQEWHKDGWLCGPCLDEVNEEIKGGNSMMWATMVVDDKSEIKVDRFSISLGDGNKRVTLSMSDNKLRELADTLTAFVMDNCKEQLPEVAATMTKEAC